MSQYETEIRWAKLASYGTTCFKYSIAACATLHFYYTVTHFDEEVEYIWSRKWTVGKVMYLLTRYLGTIFLICSLIGVSAYNWNDSRADTRFDGLEPPTLKNLIPTCFHGMLFSGLGPMIILVAEVILQMRVYALYGRDKKLLAFFILLTISLVGFDILQMSDLFLLVEQNSCDLPGGCFAKRSMYRRVFIPYIPLYRYACVDAHTISGIGWTVIAFTEFILFLMVIIKARKRLFKRREKAMPHDIRASMAKDSLSYFAVLFSVCFFGAIIQFVPEHAAHSDFVTFLSYQGNSYAAVAVTIMTILAPRLIINLREEVYGPSEITESQLSWNADVSGHSSSGGDVADSTDAGAGGGGISDPERA